VIANRLQQLNSVTNPHAFFRWDDEEDEDEEEEEEEEGLSRVP